MVTPVGTYARLSYIYEEGDDLGIARQEHDTRTLIKLRGWEPKGSYVDPDLSAYHPKITRPEFEKMLSDLEAGVIKGVVAYDLDRLFRQPSDLERLIKIYDRIPGLVFATVQGDINLATSDGRTLARVMVAFANKASADTARRVARQKLEKAMSGQGTSNYRPFGWEEDGSLNETEAGLLREAIRQIFAGVSLPSITISWTKRGIKTVRGKDWHSYTLRRVLSAPRLAGLAIYQGDILMEDGKPVKGNWTPLLEETEWRALHDIINPRKGRPPVRRKHYLMSGIARCGLCGMGMVGGYRTNGKYHYTCRSIDSGGCAKVSIAGAKLDQQITALVLAYTKDHQIVETEIPDFDGARLVEIAGKIAELMHEYREGGMSAGLIFPEIRKLETEQRQLETERNRYTRQKKRATTITGEWPDLELAEQRAVILSVLEAIVVAPTGRGGGGYRPERVTPVWR